MPVAVSPVSRLGLRLAADVTLGQSGPLLRRLVELAAAAEEAGFDTLWVSDRTGEPGSRPEAVQEPYTTLGALAVSTTTLRLGALASPVPGRGPSLLAKQLTAVDVVSGGRGVLGLRLGTRRWAGRRAGLECLDEAAQVCRALLGGELSTFNGQRFHLEQAANRPQPVQAGGPPIVLAGPGRGVLAVAASRADGVFVTTSPTGLRRHVAELVELCGRAGRDPARVSVIASVQAPSSTWRGDDPSPLVRAASALRRAGADGVVVEVPAGARPDVLAKVGAALHQLG